MLSRPFYLVHPGSVSFAFATFVVAASLLVSLAIRSYDLFVLLHMHSTGYCSV